MPAHGAGDGFGCDGRKLVAEIVFSKCPPGDAACVKTMANKVEMTFRGDSAQHQMRMFLGRSQERACCFDACVTGLDGLLREGEIASNENVEIGMIGLLSCYLGELVLLHDESSKKREC